MIVQTKASTLTQLMKAECRQDRAAFIDAVQDALIMAREAALATPTPNTISNDRTTLPHQKR